MRKLDASPNRTTLVKLLQSDPIDRNADLKEFAGILKSLEGGFSLFLDADWGSGKTFFIKQAILLLEEANPILESHGGVENLLQPKGDLALYSELNSYLPVYYNAWENDHWDDPLPSIAAAIACQGDVSASFTSDTETREKITGTLDAILGLFGRSGANTLVEAFSGKDLIRSYRERESLRSAVSNLIDAVLPEKANTLLLVVDELDRCRPSFAIRVLEQLKNLFTDDRVVVVYSVNASQLTHVVEGMYGQGFDGQRYLSRFYDLSVPLRKVDSSKYLVANGLSKTSSSYFDIIVSGLARAYAMTMRDINRYLTELHRARSAVIDMYKEFGNYHIGKSLTINQFVNNGLVPVILAMEVVEPDSYKSVVENFDVDSLYNAFTKCKEAIDFMDATWGSYEKIEGVKSLPVEEKKAARLELLEALIYRIWCTDKDNPKFQDSRCVIDVDWGFDALSHLLATII